MDDRKPPNYAASTGISNPAYPGAGVQQPYPPMQPPQGYPPQEYPPQQPNLQQPYPPQQQLQSQYVYPPIIQQTNLPAPPPYDDNNVPKGYGRNMHGDIEENIVGDNIPVVQGIMSFDDKSIRLGFIRKVFAILALQMAVTIGMTALFLFHKPTRDYVQSSFSLYISAYVLFVVLYFVLVCCMKVARKYPANVILLALFTLSLGYLVAAISSFHETNIVLAAFGMTIFCTGAVVLFACQTKYDITKCSGVLFCLTISLFLFGIFAGVLVSYKYMRIINVVYAGLGALLFMGFLAYDIQTIMGGRKYEVSPEDYVYAALQLYIDVTYIFLFILQLFNGK